ncbi:MAG: hypothetical protein ACREPP_12415 [Rhodanobacteraceae bacterium]
MAAIALIEAVTQALAYEMQHDDSVVVLGEDVGVNGGVFRATVGLQEKFGELRVLDTPLDETTIAGVTVGLAAQGMKPVAEAQFEGFIYPMMEQIACHAARLRTRTRGRITVPAVFRATQGLQEKFGELRVLDTPLDETTIAGVTVGLAAQGM